MARLVEADVSSTPLLNSPVKWEFRLVISCFPEPLLLRPTRAGISCSENQLDVILKEKKKETVSVQNFSR